MKILHVLKSEPDAIVSRIIEKNSQETECVEIPLYVGELDYDLLVREIFESDRVICWW